MSRRSIGSVLLVLLLLGTGTANAQPKVISSFSLHDARGAMHSLSDWDDSEALVVVFLGTECPLAKLYAQRLVDLRRRFHGKGVGFVGINPNNQDTLREIGQFVLEHKVDFPVLKDPGQKVADLFGATRTPMAFLLDRDRVVRYQGRIDDQYGIGYARPRPKESELADAIEQLLAGEEITSTVTEAVGCLIGRSSTIQPTGDITYCNQVVRILNKHCVRCHRDDQIAPFALDTFEDVAAWAEMIVEVVNEGRMPPWHASPEHGRFANDAHMPEGDKRTLAQWVNNGMPEGDAADLPEKVHYTQGWQIPDPDIVLSMPSPFRVPAKGVVPYQYFEVASDFENDTWIKVSEIRPGNPAVVHHAFAFFLPPGQEQIRAEDPIFNAIAGFAPGMPANLWPQDHLRLVPAGSRIFFQLHYTPTGSEQFDQTKLGLVVVDPQEVMKEVEFGIAVNMDFRIPPRTANHQVRSGYQFTQDTLLHSLFPHMHYRGKSFRITAQYPEGHQEILLDVPNYDFNWQLVYELAKPKLMPEKTVLLCEGVFDNSEDNPANPDPTKEVRWGDQSWEEMMLGSFTTSLPNWIKPGEYPKVEHVDGNLFKVTFRYLPDRDKPTTVSVAGTFNDWNPERDFLRGPDEGGYFWGTLDLPRGQHEYKFVVDGSHWTHDPENPYRTGPFTNSKLRVQRE